ncbi:MAG: hypothetical protein QM811_12160 [Pirellulales bacterium]
MLLRGATLETLETGTQAGVPAIIDLRGATPTNEVIAVLSEQAAIRAVILDVHRLTASVLDIALRKFACGVVIDSDAPCEPQLAALQALAARYDICVFVDADRFKAWSAFADWDYPVVPFRAGTVADWSSRRAAADRLQADLAEHGDFAGYLCADLNESAR